MPVRVKSEQAIKGVMLPSQQPVELVIDVPPRGLLVRLDIDPAAASSYDDKFRLFATDGSWEQKKSIKDDQKAGDAFVDLRFEGMSPLKKFTLEHDPGKEGDPVFVFEDVPYADLIALSHLETPEPEKAEGQKLILRLDLDPEAAENADDVFRLFSSDGSYEQKKTVKDDMTKGDQVTDLEFTDLDPGLSYALEHDPGGGEAKVIVFEERTYAELIDSSWMVPEGVDDDTTDKALRVRLEIDPKDARSFDDRFTLTSSDGSYSQVKTIKNDQKAGDAWVDLEFTGLKRQKNYTLEIDLGKNEEGKKYKVFEDQPFDTLEDLSWMVPPDEEPEDKDAKDDLLIRLELDPKDKGNLDDTFTLESADGAISITKTVKDDAKDGDKFVDLQFEKLDRNGVYTLQHDDGTGTVTPVFSAVPYAELAGTSWMVEGEPDDPDADKPGEFILRVERDPADAKAADDRFTLKSDDGAYEKTLGPKDDFVPNNHWLDLKFTELDRTKTYTLTADLGTGEEAFKVFEGVAYGDLAGLSWNVPPSEVTIEEE